MSTGIKLEALPLLDLLEAGLGRKVDLLCLEDNTKAIAAVRNGYSPVLRHLSRTERISLGTLHELFIEQGDRHHLEHQPTAEHKGDVFTKRLEPHAFESAVSRMGLQPIGARAASAA